ncbi:hypothetical protein FO519_009967 [Halicephalobus sp. NKZ332]|nr:hypothetical protein FO519_009967 [Halicephalobus sp. NKZ332]
MVLQLISILLKKKESIGLQNNVGKRLRNTMKNSAIMLNSPIQGLLHTMIRHWGQWQTMLPNSTLSFFSQPVVDLIDQIEKSSTPGQTTPLIKNFVQILATLAPGTFIDAFDLQIDIHSFIQKNVTYENYLGEGVNTYGKLQVYWKVKDTSGKPLVMVTCMSEQLFPPENGFDKVNPGRPIRTITTIFFITEKEANKRKSTKQY